MFGRPRFLRIANLNGHMGPAARGGAYRNSIIGIPIRLRTPYRRPAGRRRNTTQPNYGEPYPHRRSGFVWVLVALVLIAVVAAAVALAARYYYPPTMPYAGYPYFGWFFFPLGILFIFFIVFFVARLIFWPLGRGGMRRYWYRYGDAREILRRRYASGEISKDQFEQMMRDLEQHQ